LPLEKKLKKKREKTLCFASIGSKSGRASQGVTHPTKELVKFAAQSQQFFRKKKKRKKKTEKHSLSSFNWPKKWP
jgi:hypothetical protein